MRKKRPASSVEVALEAADAMREAAARAEHVARRVLRRTHLLARHAARGLPVAPIIPVAEPQHPAGEHVTLALPSPPPSVQDEQARQIADLQARLERAEHATAWLRARLRATHARRHTTPSLDGEALATDLAHGLAGLRSYHEGAVRPVVLRVLAAHGLPLQLPIEGRPEAGRVQPGAQPANLPGWPRERQEAVAAQVLARAPEVADRLYVYRVLALIAARGRTTLPELLRAAGLDSAMARRRLRLAAETLAALGVLAWHEGAYTLTMETQHQQHSPRTTDYRRASHHGPSPEPVRHAGKGTHRPGPAGSAGPGRTPTRG